MKDPLSGHLDRIQIIKGWLDADGVTREKVFNVVWGDAHARELQPDGKLPAVGNTVNVADAEVAVLTSILLTDSSAYILL